MFPYVKEAPSANPPPAAVRAQQGPTSLRSQKPSWHRAAAPKVEMRQRVIVFVAGGLTYSEVREAYSLSNTLGKDIFIGRTASECYDVLC
jgi:syntaxin-binding protein 1